MTSCVFTFYRNEPSGAAAASALGDSEVGTLDAGEVPIAVVNAAARHVKKGLFSLPFRKTTRAMQRLKPKKTDSSRRLGQFLSIIALAITMT